jgi:hypothetical protein
MSFYLKGIFTNSIDEEIIRKANECWTEIHIKIIDGKYKTLGIVGPNLLNADSDEKHEFFQEINYKIEDSLLDFSKHFPDTKFAFIFVDCWGGYCQYSGYVCQNGQTLINLSEQLGETVNQTNQVKNLKTLLSGIGIDLGDNGYFEPFTRNYFD